MALQRRDFLKRGVGLVAASMVDFDAAVLGGEAPFIHIFTSGTTGNPKGVVVPIKALALFRLYAELGLGLREDDLYWCAADPGWAYGLYHGILGVLATGVPGLLFEGGFTPETTLKIIQEHGVTNFAAAPTVYRALRTSGIAAPAGLMLRCASSCGEPLTPEVNDWALTALGVAVHDHYGQAEAGCVINNHHHPLLAGPLKPGAMGKPMPGLQAVILLEDRDEIAGVGEVGRVALDIQESQLFWFGGYVGDAKKSAEKFGGSGRWYVTGDTGRMDEDGYFCFSARDDDVIIMAGYRIGPFEVESVIAAHPSVAECAVIAVPDQIRGEVLECYVVLRDGARASESTVRDIQQWVKVRFAAHAYPRSVHFAQALPKTPSGKIQRYVLRAKRLLDLQQAADVQ